MHLTWHGFSCIKLQTTTAIVLIDPFQDQGSVHCPKLKADIVVSTDNNDVLANNIDRISGNPFQVTAPGEYEIQGVFLYGIPTSGGTCIMLEAEGLKVAHLGTTAPVLSDQELERLEGVDVLLLPVSGGSSKQLSTLISQIQPRLLVPIQFRPSDAKQPADLDVIDGFIKDLGVKDPTPQPKFIVKSNQLPVGEMQTVILAMGS
jgi:L-ascorbate metabolism protein UlaG (beta-lactamase superfamily)